MMTNYFTVSTDAKTGETTVIPWTEEEIAARQERLLAMTPVPAFIIRRQAALQLYAMSYISAQEALDMVKTATLPQSIEAVFDSLVTDGSWTADQRILAEIDFAASNYYRDNSLLALMGLTSEQIDQFFIAAKQR
jgi:hypothetical protein